MDTLNNEQQRIEIARQEMTAKGPSTDGLLNSFIHWFREAQPKDGQKAADHTLGVLAQGVYARAFRIVAHENGDPLVLGRIVLAEFDAAAQVAGPDDLQYIDNRRENIRSAITSLMAQDAAKEAQNA